MITRRGLLCACAVLLGLFYLGSSPTITAAPRSHSGQVRVLVKIKPSLATQVEAALPSGEMVLLPGQSRTLEIESFLTRHSAQKLSPLYPNIVKLKKLQGLTDFQIAANTRDTFSKRAARLHAAFQPPEISRTYVLELDETLRASLPAILKNLQADQDVEFAEEDHIVSASLTPNDPYLSTSGTWGQPYDDLWGIKKIGAPAAWDTNTGAGIVVAVVDTGIDYKHPDIATNMWPQIGADFVGSSIQNPQQGTNPIDHMGHGTHVAGTIAAVGNNGLGVIGVAWHAQVMAVKGLDDTGQGLDSTIGPAILYAANNGADVINASWGGFGSSQTIADAISYAYNMGVVFVAAAGNSGMDALGFYPANLPNVITVAATDPYDNLASFSNYGSKIDVAAPGVDILSLQADGTNMGTVVSPGYTRASGTSMATPHVSGLAALILSANPGYSNEDVRQGLRVSATLGIANYNLNLGYGRINAAAAIAVGHALEAKILFPVDGTVTKSSLTIAGVARGSGFASYILEYGSGALPTSWTTIHTSTTPTPLTGTGTLGVFDPTTLPDGTYDLRLTVYNTSGQAFVDRMEIVVQYVSITSPTPPAVPSVATVLKPGGYISVSGTASGPSFVDFHLEWAKGIVPTTGWSASGVTLNGGGASPVINGALANWDTSSINAADYYTIRLVVDDSGFSSQAYTLVYLEPDLLSSNWPKWLYEVPGQSSGMVPANNPLGEQRLLLTIPEYLNSTVPSALRIFSADGSSDTSVSLQFGAYTQPAAADFLALGTGDQAVTPDRSLLSIVAADNAVTAFSPCGQGSLQYSQTVLNPLLDNSQLEAIGYASDFSSRSYVCAYRPNGQQLNSNFPIPITDQNSGVYYSSSPQVLVGDIDGDGKPEFIVQQGTTSSSFGLLLFDSNGVPKTWLNPNYSGYPYAMALADLDRNGKLQIILAADTGSAALLHVLQPDGSERPGWPVPLPYRGYTYVAIGDLNLDGREEIVVAQGPTLNVLNADGSEFSSAWPQYTTYGYGPVVLADVDGDGYPEIVTGALLSPSTSSPLFPAIVNGTSNAVQPGDVLSNRYLTISPQDGTTVQYWEPQLLALRRNATLSKSWRLLGSNGFQPWFPALVTVGDFNNDGITDIAVTYTIRVPTNGTVFLSQGVATVLSTGTPFYPKASDWPMIYHDQWNTATFQKVVPTITGVTSSINPSIFGQSVALTATVAPELNRPGIIAPTGQVNFLDSAVTLGSCTLTGRSCSLAVSSLSPGVHSLTAKYVGDAHSLASVSPILAQMVKAATTTTLTSSPNPTVFGQPVVISVSIAVVPPGTATLNGQVSVVDGTTNIGSCMPTSGSCTITTSTLAVGTHNITAQYAGGSDSAPSTSAVLKQVVNPSPTSTSITSSANPSVFGQSVAIAVTVGVTLPGVGTPTGQVTVFNGTTALGSCTLTSGACTLSTSTLATGNHSLTAQYAGDSYSAASISAILTQIVNTDSTTTKITSSLASSVFGQTIQITATVSAVAPGIDTPTGQVSFLDGSTNLGTCVLASGSCTFSSSTLAVGTHNLTAHYAGDSNASASTSATLTQLVNTDATTTKITSSLNPAVFGQTVQIVATVAIVSPGTVTPSGQVTILDGSTALGSCTLAFGSCTITTSTLAVGTHSLTVQYPGDSNASPSTSAMLVQIVNTDSTTTKITSSLNPSLFGQTVQIAATVGVVAPGITTPTGSVTVFDGTAQIGSCTLASGACTLSTSTLATGNHSLTAQYAGDSNSATSTSAVLLQVVAADSTTTKITSSLASSVFGQTIQITATVFAVAPGIDTPTGQVSFLDGSTTLGTCVLASGSCTFSSSALAVGTHNLTAHYAGDSNASASTSATLAQLVNTDSTTIKIASSLNPSVFGQTVQVSATVAAVAPGINTPSGQINVLDGSTTLGSCTLASGSCTLTSSTLAVGTHTFTAQYSGDTNSAGSTSAPLAQVINSADFSIAASSAQTVNAGSSAIYTITIAPNPSPYDFAVTNFGCTNLPTGAACAFGTNSVTPGTANATVTMTISTTSRTVAMAPRSDVWHTLFAASYGFVCFGLLGLVAGTRRQKAAKLGGFVVALAFIAFFMLGCAAGGAGSGGTTQPPPNPNGTPAGTYSVVLTAAGSSGVTHTTTVALTVK